MLASYHISIFLGDIIFPDIPKATRALHGSKHVQLNKLSTRRNALLDFCIVKMEKKNRAGRYQTGLTD